METLLITIEELRTYVDLPGNLESTYITPRIAEAQIQFVEGMIGPDFYNELTAQYPDGLSYANLAFLPYLKPIIAFRTYQLYLLSDGMFNTPMGLRTYGEDNSTPISQERRNSLVSKYRGLAEAKEKTAHYFLSNNLDDYPLYSTYCGDVKPSKSFGISAIKRGNRRGSLPPLGTGKTWRDPR